MGTESPRVEHSPGICCLVDIGIQLKTITGRALVGSVLRLGDAEVKRVDAVKLTSRLCRYQPAHAEQAHIQRGMPGFLLWLASRDQRFVPEVARGSVTGTQLSQTEQLSQVQIPGVELTAVCGCGWPRGREGHGCRPTRVEEEEALSTLLSNCVCTPAGDRLNREHLFYDWSRETRSKCLRASLLRGPPTTDWTSIDSWPNLAQGKDLM